ncbi:MAG TPA: periplasmic heavy metal sensor [bacterium]|nr:periplasmic heavy metal sensor [bacterium]
MNKWLVALLVFSLAVNLAVVGTLIYFTQRPEMAHRGAGGPVAPPGAPQGMPPRPGDEGVWPGGRTEPNPKMEKLRLAYHEQLQPLHGSMLQLQQDLIRLIEKKPAPADSIELILQRMTGLRGEMEKLTVQHLLAIRPYLEEEEWRHLTRMLQNRMREPRPARPEGPTPIEMENPGSPNPPPDPRPPRD